MSQSLTVEGLTYSYGHLQVLFGIDLEVNAGEAIALLGTNGAGKSTILRLVAGLLGRPTSGQIRLGDSDITGQPAERLVGQGLVLIQGGKAAFRDMTVADHLDIQALTRRTDPDSVKIGREKVFTTFPRLRERMTQKAGSMSGGEQQQLALAKALILSPSILMIDELSLGLAPVVVQQLLQVVREIHAQGTTVIMVEQSLNIAADICERAVFLEKGQVRFEGRTDELLERDDVARAVFLGAG